MVPLSRIECKGSHPIEVLQFGHSTDEGMIPTQLFGQLVSKPASLRHETLQGNALLERIPAPWVFLTRARSCRSHGQGKV